MKKGVPQDPPLVAGLAGICNSITEHIIHAEMEFVNSILLYMVQCHDMHKIAPIYTNYNQYINYSQRFIRQKKIFSSNAQVSRNTLRGGSTLPYRFGGHTQDLETVKSTLYQSVSSSILPLSYGTNYDVYCVSVFSAGTRNHC